jgi:hypothetical protein
MAKPPAGLHVSPDLTLPLDAVTQTFALLGVRRGGKSNAAAVMAEEMSDAGQPFVAIDPKGDWWGLRSNAAGDGPGLPIPIFGGLHGDMPLAPESGALMAELIFEHNLTCILDVSRFSKAGRIRFLTAFAERLYELHQADPQPRHIFLEEADRVLPQRVMQDMAACVGAYSDLIRLGGAFGLGVTLISQRSAVINKDGLTQVETMIPLRTTSPQDRKAIRDWMEHHAIAPEIVESLPSLLSGEAWVSSSFWLAEHGLPPIQKIRFRQRRTFDSGATPKVGQQRRVATLADIDLSALGDRMAAVVEKAARDDPAKLRRRIAELERKLTSVPAAAELDRVRAENQDLRARLTAAEQRPPETVEVPVIADGDIRAMEIAVTLMKDATGKVADAVALARQPATAVAPAVPVPRSAPIAATVPAPAEAGPAEGLTLGKAHRAILAVLAQFPAGRTRTQLGLLSGYSVKSSGFGNALGALRSAGLLNRGQPIQITPDGLAALGDDWEPLPTGEALTEHWMRQLGKAERAILTFLLEAWPATVTRDELAAGTGYSASSSGFGNALGRLRSLDLVNRGPAIAVDETFAREVGRGSG